MIIFSGAIQFCKHGKQTLAIVFMPTGLSPLNGMTGNGKKTWRNAKSFSLKMATEHLTYLHSELFSPNFCFAGKTVNVLGMCCKSDICQEPIDILASKLTFFCEVYYSIDQFQGQNISWLLKNISFAIHALNVQCFSATVHSLRRALA